MTNTAGTKWTVGTERGGLGEAETIEAITAKHAITTWAAQVGAKLDPRWKDALRDVNGDRTYFEWDSWSGWTLFAQREDGA